MKKILIIDDEEDIAKLAAKRLTHAGYEVKCYPRGEGACEEASRVKPDLILLDIRLPDISGLEVFDFLTCHSVNKNIPIVFFSANAGLKEECLKKKQARGFIKKPYDPESLIELVNSLTLGK